MLKVPNQPDAHGLWTMTFELCYEATVARSSAKFFETILHEQTTESLENLCLHAAVGVLREGFISFSVVSKVQMMFEYSCPQSSLKTAACFKSRVHGTLSECKNTPEKIGYLTVDIVASLCYSQ